jgi:hypothetical protein
MLWMALAVTGLQLAVLYLPLLKGFFQVQRLSPVEIGVCAACGVLVLAAVELEKRLAARRAS